MLVPQKLQQGLAKHCCKHQLTVCIFSCQGFPWVGLEASMSLRRLVIRIQLSETCPKCRFQFILIVPALFVEFFDRASAFREAIMLLLAINTVLSILRVEKYLDAKDNNEIQSGSRVNATIAGQSAVRMLLQYFETCYRSSLTMEN